MVGPNGQLVHKKAVVALPAVPKAGSRENKIQMFGDVAVVTGIYSGVGTTGDQEQRFTRVWRKQNGHWVMGFGQVTRITPPPAAGNSPAPNNKVEPTMWPEGRTQDERDVLRTQRSLNELFARKDANTYAQLTADSYTRIGNSVTTRAEFLKAVAGTPELKRIESNNSDLHFRTYGPTAVLTFIDKAVTGPPQGNRMSRIFVKEKGTWKQLVTQITPIAQQPK